VGGEKKGLKGSLDGEVLLIFEDRKSWGKGKSSWIIVEVGGKRKSFYIYCNINS
jgi:hypothetical protein